MKTGRLNVVNRRINRILAMELGFALLAALAYIRLAGVLTFIDAANITIILGASGIAIALLARSVFPRMRRLPFPVVVLVSATLYTAVGMTATSIEIWIARAIQRNVALSDPRLISSLLRDSESPFFVRGFMVAFGAFFLTAFLLEISRKLGPGVLRNWLLGRYRNPMAEERIFMFLDLKNSTTIAEKLGAIEYSRILQGFFCALTEPILESGGEVSHFIGDEVVISWRLDVGLHNCACLDCFFGCKTQLERLRLQFLTTYGVVPEFKAGLHCGPVVAAEVGEVKSEVVFVGDVLNTTSRIQRLCRELGYDLLLSRALADQLVPKEAFEPVDMGEQTLKGKEDVIEIVGSWRADSDQSVLSSP